MRVLVDTNIILDDFLEREPFVEDAAFASNLRDFEDAVHCGCYFANFVNS